jgi:5-methylcytosine-specific restriction endonuclease McrA
MYSFTPYNPSRTERVALGKRIFMKTCKRNWKRIKSLLKRDGNLCHICKLPMLAIFNPQGGECRDLQATVDHILPASMGGKWSMSNVKLAHYICNNSRGCCILTEITKDFTYSCRLKVMNKLKELDTYHK